MDPSARITTVIFHTLAQSPARHLPTLFFYLSLVVFMAVVVIVVAVVLRKRFGRDEPTGQMPFTLSQLRELRASGQVDDAEYERMKAGILARYRPAEKASAQGDDQPDR